MSDWTNLSNRLDEDKNGFLNRDELNAAKWNTIGGRAGAQVAALRLLRQDLFRLAPDPSVDISQHDIRRLVELLQAYRARSQNLDNVERNTAAVFDYLDENGDQVLDKRELSQKIFDRKLSTKLEPTKSFINRELDHLIKNKPWWSFDTTISINEVAASVKTARMELWKWDLMSKVDRLFSDAKQVNISGPIWGSGGVIRAGNVRQGLLYDCYFLAALSSLAQQRPQDIRGMIGPSSEPGWSSVTFPSAPGDPVAVKHPHLSESLLYARPGRYGLWPTVIDQGYAIREMNTNTSSNVVFGGSIKTAINVLTGHSCKGYKFGTTGLIYPDSGWLSSAGEVETSIAEALRAKRIVVAAITQKQTEGLKSRHAYSVLDFDTSTKFLTLRNPEGRNERLNNWGSAADGVNDGVFKMSLREFIRNFDELAIELPR